MKETFTNGYRDIIEVEDGRIVNVTTGYPGGNDQARDNHHAAVARGVLWIQAAKAIESQQRAADPLTASS